MAKLPSLRFSLLAALIVPAAMTVAPVSTYAAGTITIDQTSQIDQYGSWRLNTPKGIVDNRKKDSSMIIEALEGKYLLTLEPPEGAITTIRFFDGATLLNTTEGTQVSFTFGGNGTLRAEISYRYEGVVVVTSSPSGTPFELKGPQGVRRTGVTPATFNRMPPFYFTASFNPIPNCQQPRPQGRSMRPNAKLVFHADYICAGEIKTVENTPPSRNRVSVPRSESTTPAAARIQEEQQRANVQLFHELNQGETVAGSTVFVTVGVRNVGRTTLRNVILSEQFDSTKVSLPKPLPGGGVYRGTTAVWEIPRILAGKSFTIRIPVKVVQSLNSGDQTVLTARVSGENVHAPRGELLSKKVAVGVVALPATGRGIGIVFILLSALGAFTMNPIIRRKQVVVPTVVEQ